MRSAKIAALFCLLVGLIQAAAAEEIIRVTAGEYAPWTSKSLKHGGFSGHVITEAFKLEGYAVEFTYYPWKRVYEAAKDGKRFHASSWWYFSEERAKHFHYSEPLLIDSTVFFHLKGKPLPEWETLDDLKGKRIGATSGYTYTKEFWDAQESKRLNIQVANTDELNFKKLLKGRIDMFPTSQLVGQKLLQEMFSHEDTAKIAFHSKPLRESGGHLLFSKNLENAEELLATFNRGLAKLKKSGRYAQFQEDLIAGKYEQ